jgi:tetratricopeptide (TPR) repeat protein
MTPTTRHDQNAPLQEALSLHRSGQFVEAAALYKKLIKQAPKDPAALKWLGMLEFQQDHLQESVRLLQLSLQINPNQPDALSFLGSAFQALDQLDQAVGSFDRAIALNPDNADAYSNRGFALHGLNRFEEALASCDQAIALNPGNAKAHNNRGLALESLYRLADALESYDRAIALNPDIAMIHNNRGNALQALKRLDEALESYNRAIALQPDFAEAHFNVSLTKILMGDFEEGWKLYEWRWKKDQQKKYSRNFTQPLWLGDQPVAGKTILIHTEQGLGDFIQFCRYAPMVAAMGARVLLETPVPLISLAATLKGNITIINYGEPPPPFDLHCPILSLPLAFKTAVTSIPASVPYLYTDPDRQKSWQLRLGTKSKPRIGLVWSGSASHKNDRNRSIPLRIMKPLLQLPAEFHAMQRDIRQDDAALISRLFSKFRKIRLHHDQLYDFSNTAAVIQEMDLAGALGKAVWILLPYAPEYRWMLDRSDSPWYPTATLFRQGAPGDWESVIIKVAAKLVEIL